MSLAAPSDHPPLWYSWRSVPRTIHLSPQGDVGCHNVGTPTRDLLAYLLAHQPTDYEIKHVRNHRFYIHSLLQQEKPFRFGHLVLKYLFGKHWDLSFFCKCHHLLNMFNSTARSGGNIDQLCHYLKTHLLLYLPINITPWHFNQSDDILTIFQLSDWSTFLSDLVYEGFRRYTSYLVVCFFLQQTMTSAQIHHTTIFYDHSDCTIIYH